MSVAAELGIPVELRRYLKEPPTRDELQALVAQLEDPVTNLVRRDKRFTDLGLTDDDVATAGQVLDVLVQHPALLQRPVLQGGGRAIIGRPKDRVGPFLLAAG